MLGPLEGDGVVQWLTLAAHGIATFVLRYRLASEGYDMSVATEDLRRAMQTVRFHARAWGLDRNRTGVMCVSAGGLLAAASRRRTAPAAALLTLWTGSPASRMWSA